MTSYAELHCHSNYSFKEGASSLEELIIRAMELKYPAMALTDHDNLCGAMEFARIANSMGIQPITGAEITMEDGSHVTLLSKTRQGYSNLCNLITYSRIGSKETRTHPRLEWQILEKHCAGLILLTGCRKAKIAHHLSVKSNPASKKELGKYIEWFGVDNVYVELQQNLVYGDTLRNQHLYHLAKEFNVGVVATNNVHYHRPERHRLQDVLVSIQHNKTLEESHINRRANSNFYLKSYSQMADLFQKIPDAIQNTIYIAQKCTFNLETDLGYKLPQTYVPAGYSSHSYLEKICHEAAIQKYGQINFRIQERLKEEFRLVEKLNLSGFFLIYHEVIQLARQIMTEIEIGINDSLEYQSPGRGRGSSVSMLIGYLIGLSHIDPLEYDLSIDRFIHDETEGSIDIDLDFPREIRGELIKRIHEKYGWEHAALAGAISTYKIKGCIRDLGKVLGINSDDVDILNQQIDINRSDDLQADMSSLPMIRDKLSTSIRNNLAQLSSELLGFPKYLMQHSGGMIISSDPLINMVPIQPGAIENRYVCHWDKDSINDADFVKIDFLGLGALSQMQKVLHLIKKHRCKSIDLSRINFNDEEVYRSIHKADTIGVFQIESAAQMQTVIRLKPNNLQEMAYEIAAVRPGVGINNGINQFIERYRNGAKVEYVHDAEIPVLGRTLGIILFQDQVNSLAREVAGFGPKKADDLRRAFSRKNNSDIITKYWIDFRDGAASNGIPEESARKIFSKFSGQYMFPESHAYAFGITAYQMAWLKYYYTLEFYVAIFNEQPMGFYNLESLKQDAKHHGFNVLNPDINESMAICKIMGDKSFILGLSNVKGVGESRAHFITSARENGGNFRNIVDFIRRTRLPHKITGNLVDSGAFDSITPDRRSALWQIRLIHRTAGDQQALLLPIEQDLPDLPLLTEWEKMLTEYRIMNIHPKSHFMAYLRPHLGNEVTPNHKIHNLEDGTEVTVVGLVIRRQHPHTNAIFITLEDEHGHIPLIIWPQTFKRYRLEIRASVLKVRGQISRRNGTMNIVAQHIENLPFQQPLSQSKNWS